MKRKYIFWMIGSSAFVLLLWIINYRFNFDIADHLNIIVSLLALNVAILKISNEDKPRFKFQGKIKFAYERKNEFGLIILVLEVVNSLDFIIANPVLLIKVPRGAIWPNNKNGNQLHSVSNSFDTIVDSSQLYLGGAEGGDNFIDYEIIINQPYLKEGKIFFITLQSNGMDDFCVSIDTNLVLDYLGNYRQGQVLQLDTRSNMWKISPQES